MRLLLIPKPSAGGGGGGGSDTGTFGDGTFGTMLFAGGGFTPPPPFVLDSMTDTNGTGLVSHVGETGAAWTMQTGHTLAGQIISNRWRPTTNASSSAAHASGVPDNANYKVTATIRVVSVITANSNSVGVIGRASTSANTFYHARLVPGTSSVWQLFKFVAGTATQLGTSAAASIAAGGDYQLDLAMVDNQISLLVNNTTLVGPITDAAITAPGLVGVRGSGVGVLDSTGAHISDVKAVSI